MSFKHHKIPFIRFPYLSDEVKIAVNEVLEGGFYFNGDFTRKFNKDFSSYLKVKHCVPTANCTDALEIILRAKNIGKNDEVIVPAFTWFSDASVVSLVGAQVVFGDIDTTHFGMSVHEITSKITPSTKAIILAHLFGIIHPQISEIKKICEDKNIMLIEDCAQAHGARLNGQLAGSFGDVAAFSFYPTKNLGALGDAGAILTNDLELAKKCSLWANHGQKMRNEHVQLGKNSRMDEIQAAVLTAKLPTLDSENLKRRELAKLYFKELNHLPITLPLNSAGHVYHQFVIMIDRRDDLKSFLAENNIETDIHYPHALVGMEPFNSENLGSYPNAHRASQTVLSLPVHPSITSEEVFFICEFLKLFFKK